MIAAKASALCYARSMASISMASASVIPAGRARNARCATTSARWPIAMAMGTASVANANACAATRENSVKKVAHAPDRQIYKISTIVSCIKSKKILLNCSLYSLFTVDCPHPNCSGHGFCADGTCICKKGWKGTDCATMDQDALQCLPDCSGHGTFDLDTQTCTCESKWSGDDCSKELCDLDCGQHGRCEGDACACDPEWGGDYCNTKLCDSRCNEHGQCKNGTCLCVTGWNGKHCTIEGCPNSCAGHGQCRVSGEGQWECRCYEGWDGPDCGIALELNCGDSKDNDNGE